MNTKTVIMDFSGVYKQENFYYQKEVQWMDFTHTTGVNCYCTEEAAEEIKDKIRKCDFSGIHFLDSGNYHYLSKFWVEKIQTPFSLVVFDNHTDMQEASFWGMLSCGSWVRELILSNANMLEVCIVGPSRQSFEECEQELQEKVIAVSKEEIKKESDIFSEFLERNKEIPLYISIDKDIFSREYARTNWDQGEVTFSEVENWINMAFVHRFVLGADICGENSQDTTNVSCQEDFEINNEINEKLWQLLDKKITEQEYKVLDKKFLETKQADKKLSIALQRYFDIDNENKMKRIYAEYLKLRFRPAMAELMKQKENKKMIKLLRENNTEGNILDIFIREAIKYNNQEAQILLLREKEKHSGFQERNWEL